MKKYQLNKIGTRLKSLRTKMGLSREALAKKAKINYNTIIKLEAGANKNPTIQTLIGLARVFKISVEDLLV